MEAETLYFFFKKKLRYSFKEVLPADPVIATMGVPKDLRIIHDKFEKVLSVSFTNIFLGFFFE